MAELLSSSSDDDNDIVCGNGSAAWRSEPRVAVHSASASTRVSSYGDGTIDSAASASDNSENELLESMFASTPRYSSAASRAVGRARQQRNDNSRAAATARARTGSSTTLDDADAVDARKPVISARELLLKLLPKKSATTPTALSVHTSRLPTANPAPAAYSSRAGSFDAAAAADRTTASQRASPGATPPQQSSMAASERIARKYGLMPTTSRPATLQAPRVSDVNANAAERAHTPTATRIKHCERTPQPRSADQSRERNAPVYVSPFARKDGLAAARQQRQQRRDAAAASAAIGTAADARNGSDSTEALDSSRRCQSTGRSAGKQLSRDVMASDDDDGWMSDAQDVDALKQQQRADQQQQQQRQQQQTRDTAAAEQTPSDQRNALLLERVESRSVKKRGRETLDSDSESDESNDRWPRLPLPEHQLGPLTLLPAVPGGASARVSANINSYLFDYQRVGAQFLFSAYSRDTGAILGDEMGLGKTVQVIAFVSAILGKCGDSSDRAAWRALRTARRANTSVSPTAQLTGPRPVLIVVPASLLHNWEAELQTWLCCSIVLLLGRPIDRDAILEQIPRGEYEIVICSYDILKLSVEQLNAVAWAAVVLDEMHCLKNPDAQLTRAVQSLTCPRKLGLTGTLMQNNEKELHCLVETIAPGVLGSWSAFRAFYGDAINCRKAQLLQRKLATVYLRRDKCINPRFQEVAKCDQVVLCDLTPLQRAAYTRILALPEFELLRTGDELCDCGRASKRTRKQCCYQTPADLKHDDSSTDNAVIWRRFHADGTACKSCPNCVALVCVAQLLKLANHMELLKVNPRDPPVVQTASAHFATLAFGTDVTAVGGVQQVASFQALRALGTTTCGKMRVLEQLLGVWATRREKTLLFSRSTRMLDILQLFLVTKAIAYLRLDGQTKVSDRLRLVNDFNSPDSRAQVFLISTKAGGLGLNLPSATNVVIFDPSWNPAHDCQAQDRAYRIGQTRDVHVYRLITLGTIEEMIYVRQIYKQQLSDTTLRSGGGAAAPRYFDAVQGDRHQQGELFGIRNLLCWNERGVLAGIQDAYRRSADGLVVQQNQVDCAKAAATTAAAKRNVAAATTKRLAAGVPNGCDNEEMVDVADEIVTTIVATRAAPLPALTPRSQETVASADDGDDAQHALLNGARTLLHEAVVSKQPQVQHAETIAGNIGESTAAMAAPPVLPAARPSARHSRSRQTQLQPTPRKRIYIPKYL